MVVGGLGRHVHHLATALAAAGHEVVVLSRRPFGTDPVSHPTSDETHEGVRVIAVAQDPHEFEFGRDMMAWTLAMGHAMIRAGLALLGDWRPDVVHARLAGRPPCIALADFFCSPWFPPSTPPKRAGTRAGVGPVNRQVHALESWLARSSDALIACSASMAAEIAELFGPDLADISVIPNGIDSSRWPFAKRHSRRTARTALLRPPGVREGRPRRHRRTARIRHPSGTTLTVAGDGTQQAWLIDVARRTRCSKPSASRAGPTTTNSCDFCTAPTSPCCQPLRTVRHRGPGGRGRWDSW